MENRSREIDLHELFFRFGLLIKRNLLFIFLCTAIGAGLGLTLSLVSDKVYESKMMATSELLSLSFSEELINNINLILKQKDDSLAASKLNLKPGQAEKILSFKVKSIVEDKQGEMKENEKMNLLITVQATDPEIFPVAQQCFLYFFENNEYTRIRIRQRKDYYNQLISKVDTELRDLEGFKDRLMKGNFFQELKGNVMFDPTIVNSKILDLTKERIGYVHGLQVANSIQVISGFTIPQKPSWPKASMLVVIGAALGLIIAGVLVIFNLFLKGMNEYATQTTTVS